MPIVFDTSALLRPQFNAAEFTATKWEGPEVKAGFANDLCRFMAADFKDSLFTKRLYRRLALSFGHIALYDRETFHDHFFRDLRGKEAFLEQIVKWPACGQPEYTYCDVERAVQARLHECNLLAAYRALRAAEIEDAERELLRRLKAKYDETGMATTDRTPVPILHPGRPPKIEQKKTPSEQAALF